jgi:tight adherence protein B
MSAGLAPTVAIREVEKVFGHQNELAALLATSADTGLAISRLARAEADRIRLNWRVSSEKKIQQASIRLMWPLGVAVLPAFVLIAVLPLAVSMLRGN